MIYSGFDEEFLPLQLANFRFTLAPVDLSLSQPSSLQAIGGEYGSPCSAPGDLPTVGGIVGGNGEQQSYTDPQGRIINRVCWMWKWGDGSHLDHGHTRTNTVSKCYQVTGVGTSSVTVKRIATTFQTAAWETGPEAGQCRPIEHLDVFLTQPATKTTASSTPSTNSDTNQNTNDNSTDSTDSTNNSADSDTASPSPASQVLGTENDTTQQGGGANWPLAKQLIRWWWLILILILAAAVSTWFWRHRRHQQ